jgi:hypothetical protein
VCADPAGERSQRDDDGEPKVKNARTAQSNSVWHVAGHWCEAFAPFVLDKVEERMRAATPAEGARLDEPPVPHPDWAGVQIRCR